MQTDLRSEGVQISVSDTGMGIETSDIPKLFDSFYRGQNSLNASVEGVGLGLTIVHYLVEQCGGQINIISQVGKGTIVKVIFQESTD